MVQSRTAGLRLIRTAAMCLVGAGFAAAAISGWLTDGQISGQLWPTDVNEAAVTLLGGSVDSDLLGMAQPKLNAFDVWMRLALLTTLLCAVSVIRHLRGASPQELLPAIDALRLSCFAFLLCVVWWLFWLFGELGVSWLSRFSLGVLPLWMPLVAATFCWAWWQAIIPSGGGLAGSAAPDQTQSVKPRSSFGPVVFLTGCVFAWIAVSFWLNWCLYQQLLIPHGDSAMYEEHLWNIWHGKGFRSYLDQGLFLGEHIQVIHLLLLPLHMLWPSHLLLELAESVALGSCAIPIYLIAKRHTQMSWAAAILGVAWLFYFPMHFLDIAIDQKTFRPIALGLPFLFWMIHFAEVRKFGKTLVSLLLVLSAKEDMALLTGPLLLVMAFVAGRSNANDAAESLEQSRAARHRLLGLAVFSAVYLIAVVLVIIPAFRSGDHVHYSRYFGDLGGTPGELVKTAFTDPVKVIRQAVSVQTLLYVIVFVGPLAFLPLRKPMLLIAGIFTFGMLSLLQFGGPEAGGLPPVPYHHFHAPLLAVVFWAGVVTVGRCSAGSVLGSLQSNAHGRAMLVFFCCVATSATSSMMPCSLGFWSQKSTFGYRQLYASSDQRQQKRAVMISKVIEAIPLSARVASTDYVHTRLTHCERSYDYSGYLRKVNNYQPGVPPDTDYIVIDTGHRYRVVKSPADVRELQVEPEQWELLPDTTDGIFLILKRR